jgi:hypothetical protein
MAQYYDRYEKFKTNGQIKPVPGIRIPEAASDKKVVYKKNESRLDTLSQKYYTNPYHGWLIQLANPEYGGIEFEIPHRAVIRIPFPFESAIERYINEVEKYKKLYG